VSCLLVAALPGLGIINSFLLPAPTCVVGIALWKLAQDVTLFLHLAASCETYCFRLFAALRYRAPLGFSMWFVRTASELIALSFEALTAVAATRLGSYFRYSFGSGWAIGRL